MGTRRLVGTLSRARICEVEAGHIFIVELEVCTPDSRKRLELFRCELRVRISEKFGLLVPWYVS